MLDMGILFQGEKFKLGMLLLTAGVCDKVAEDIAFSKFVTDSIKRHAAGDWGDICKDDKALNDAALEYDNKMRERGADGVTEDDYTSRIFSAYEHATLPKIWIITEMDRASTMVLFPSEY
jgi:hypothetical protein